MILSTPEIVRQDRMSVPVEAWNLERFQANPVVHWGHPKPQDAPLPIGLAASIGRSDRMDALEAEIVFASEEANPFGAQVGRAWAEGLVRAVSIDASVHAADPSPDGSHFIAREVELNFIAVVPVGADPNAMAIARAADFTEDTLARFFVQPEPILQPEPEGMTLERAASRIAAIERRGRDMGV